MLFQFGFYSSLLLIFFIHGLVYSVLLLRKSVANDSAADRWLSLFLFLCVLYIAPWMLGFGGWYDAQPFRDILFYVPFQHLYFIGPAIFFYVRSLLNPSSGFGKREWLHLIPGFLYILFSIAVVVTDQLVLHKYYFLADQQDPDFQSWYQLTGFVSMIIYFVASIRYYNRYRKMVVQVVSYADTVLFRWVRNFLVAFLIILAARLLFFILSAIYDLAYWDIWWYFLAFSLLFYYIAITGYANSAISRVSFKMDWLSTKAPLLLSYSPDTEEIEEAEIVEEGHSHKKQNDDPQLNEWKEKILEAVAGEKLFENPELTLPDLAKKLNSNVSVLSKAINQGFGMNFNDFINYYRVQAVIEMLKAGEQKKQTLLGIAFDCGFNSKATFNRAFKKVTGQSPKDWIQEKIPS